MKANRLKGAITAPPSDSFLFGDATRVAEDHTAKSGKQPP